MADDDGVVVTRDTVEVMVRPSHSMHLVLAGLAVLSLAACSDASSTATSDQTAPDAASTRSADDVAASTSSAPVLVPTDGPADPPATAGQATTNPTTTPTAPATTTSPTTAPATTTTTTLPTVDEVSEVIDATDRADLDAERIAIGTSVQGRPIVAERSGTPGGRPVLVIGVIHGDEDDGVAIVDQLRSREVPEGIELWLVESMNPDGQAAQIRHNANAVDLNRNFPYNWGPIGQPGDGQYAGTGPASEPETQAMVAFVEWLRPDITIWYHQDLFVINPSSGREGRIRARYAELVGLPLGQITGGTYTGIAATWARNALADQDGVAFIVELGPTLSPEEAAVHADAVLTVASEG